MQQAIKCFVTAAKLRVVSQVRGEFKVKGHLKSVSSSLRSFRGCRDLFEEGQRFMDFLRLSLELKSIFWPGRGRKFKGNLREYLEAQGSFKEDLKDFLKAYLKFKIYVDRVYERLFVYV